MVQENIMRHKRSEVPCYLVWVMNRPNLGKHKKEYMENVREAARKVIDKPIPSNDIEVDIAYSTSASRGSRADADNITKPTLDALGGIAYKDDKQVRSVTSSVFQKNESMTLSGRVELMQKLFYTPDRHVILIGIYSDSRLADMGGENTVREKRLNEFLNDFNKKYPSEKIQKRKWWQIWKR